MYDELFSRIRGITPEEYMFLKHTVSTMNETQLRQFLMFYSSKRKSPQDILIFTLLGFLGAAGVQRFVVGQVGMGLLYFFTGGLCVIGTIVDLVNHRNLANDYNQGVALDLARMVTGTIR